MKKFTYIILFLYCIVLIHISIVNTRYLSTYDNKSETVDNDVIYVDSISEELLPLHLEMIHERDQRYRGRISQLFHLNNNTELLLELKERQSKLDQLNFDAVCRILDSQGYPIGYITPYLVFYNISDSTNAKLAITRLDNFAEAVVCGTISKSALFNLIDRLMYLSYGTQVFGTKDAVKNEDGSWVEIPLVDKESTLEWISWLNKYQIEIPNRLIDKI